MEFLQKIIDMDKTAAARVEAAVNEERSKSDEFGERAAKERDELIAGERRRVREFIEEQEKKLSEKLSLARKVRESECAKLDEQFNAHRDEWKKEIIGRITGC